MVQLVYIQDDKTMRLTRSTFVAVAVVAVLLATLASATQLRPATKMLFGGDAVAFRMRSMSSTTFMQMSEDPVYKPTTPLVPHPKKDTESGANGANGADGAAGDKAAEKNASGDDGDDDKKEKITTKEKPTKKTVAEKQECPPKPCPTNSQCPHKGGSCCGSGQHCCQQGEICLETDPPMCAKASEEELAKCNSRLCKENFRCPYEGVFECCENRSHCCKKGYRCYGGGFNTKCVRRGSDEERKYMNGVAAPAKKVPGQ